MTFSLSLKMMKTTISVISLASLVYSFAFAMILLKKRWSKKMFNNMIKNMTFQGNNVTFYLFYDFYF